MSGEVKQNTSVATGVIAVAPTATESASDPTKTENPEDVGSEWHNTTTGEIFICNDATSDANEWIGQKGTSIQPKIIFAGGYSDWENEHGFDAPGKTNFLSWINPTSLGDLVDFGDLTEANQYFAGTSNGVNDRGIFAGGYTPTDSPTDSIQYISCSQLGNATDFGNLTVARGVLGACSNGTSDRGVFAGGGLASQPPNYDITSDRIDYVTISSPGNATDQGNLVQARDYTASVSNGTNDRAVNAAGRNQGGSSHLNVIDYWTISSGTNASDFGDLTATRTAPGVCSNDTNERGLFMCGNIGGSYGDEIDYITISSTGNASDFGDMAGATPPGYTDLGGARGHTAGSSNGTGERGLNGGGYTSSGGTSNWYKQIQYVTISTTGNGTFFGNLPERVYGPAALNNTFG